MTWWVRSLVIVGVAAICGTAIVMSLGRAGRGRELVAAELYAVVQRQIDGVRREQLPQPPMMRVGLMRIRSADRIEFGPVVGNEEKAFVQVFLVDGEDRVTPCVYRLVAEKGSWRVDDVRFLNRWPTGQHLGGTVL